MGIFRLALASLAIAAPAAGAERDARPATAGARPKVARLSFVIAQLKEEAAQARRENVWPRKDPDFAQTMGWSLPRDLAVRTLGNDLGLGASTEAYIKWQLLSFIDDFASVDLESLTQIMLAQPQAVSSISTGAVARKDFIRSEPRPPQRYIQRGSTIYRVDPPAPPPPQLPSALDIQQEMQAAVVRIDFLNEPIRKYQQALADRIPQTQALRLAVLMRRAENLVIQGSPAVAPTMAQLMEAARTASDQLSPDERRTLTQFVARLAAARGTGFSAKRIGRAIAIKPPEPETLVAPEDLSELLSILSRSTALEPDSADSDKAPETTAAPGPR